MASAEKAGECRGAELRVEVRMSPDSNRAEIGLIAMVWFEFISKQGGRALEFYLIVYSGTAAKCD